MLVLLAAVAALLTACASGGRGDDPSGRSPLGYEAEAASPAASFEGGDDEAASGGRFLAHPGSLPASTSAAEAASVPVGLDEAGDYTLWARVRGEDGDSDAIYLGFDGALQRTIAEPHGAYVWVRVERRALAEGDHRISLGLGEPGVRVDLFAIVADDALEGADLEAHFLGASGEPPAPDEAPNDEAPDNGGNDDASDHEDHDDPPEPATKRPEAGAFPLHQAPDTLPWSHVGEWTFENGSVDGNPFDLEARAIFTHTDSGDTIETGMFFDGDGRWKLRFAGTRLGTWRFETRSADEDLDGRQGQVNVTPGPEDGVGFLRPDGSKLVTAVADGSATAAVPYNVYMPDKTRLDHVGMLPTDADEREDLWNGFLDEAQHNGFPALLLGVYNNWFDYGSRSSSQHDREDPDLRTFEALDGMILNAHARGMFVHMWAWGDGARGWTPEGVGGINGEADRRLQRYIAARLGPLPGWTMSYGFDLEEWVDADEVREWHQYLQDESGWPLVLTARELGSDDGHTFSLGSDRLDVFSSDDRPSDGFYEVARERLAEGKPVMFERRFLYGRDGVWDASTTRRALWQFTMAGGAGAIWGHDFDDPTPYPNPEELRIHARFWGSHFLPSLQPFDELSQGYALATPEADRLVLYAEDVEELTLPLDALDGARRAVAVDLRGEAYEEIDLGRLQPERQAWQAPHASDWVVAVGWE